MATVHKISAPGFDLTTNKGVQEAVDNGGVVVSRSHIAPSITPSSTPSTPSTPGM